MMEALAWGSVMIVAVGMFVVTVRLKPPGSR